MTQMSHGLFLCHYRAHNWKKGPLQTRKSTNKCEVTSDKPFRRLWMKPHVWLDGQQNESIADSLLILTRMFHAFTSVAKRPYEVVVKFYTYSILLLANFHNCI